MSRIVPVALQIEVSDENVPAGQAWASVKAGEYTLFRELVYDNEINSAERNIMLLFGDRLRQLLEDR